MTKEHYKQMVQLDESNIEIQWLCPPCDKSAKSDKQADITPLKQVDKQADILPLKQADKQATAAEKQRTVLPSGDKAGE